MLFDTRYFWAVFTARSPETMDKFRRLFERSKTPYVSSVTLYEISRLTLANEGRETARLRAGTIAKEFEVVDVDSEIAEEGAAMGHALKIPMADALIMASAKRLRLPVVTDDPHFTEVKRVWV